LQTDFKIDERFPKHLGRSKLMNLRAKASKANMKPYLRHIKHLLVDAKLIDMSGTFNFLQ